MKDYFEFLQDEAPDEQEEAENNETGDENAEEKQLDQIERSGSITTMGRYPIHCLTIVGQIEGHYILAAQNKTTKYEHVIPQLVAIEQNKDIKGLLILLNTVGGDVEAGLAIAELISDMKTPTVSLVLGGGHSIGVPLAVSAQRSFIVPTATMTIHPVRMNGLLLGVPQTMSYLEKMQQRIISFVAGNSRITEERFRQLMLNTGELVSDVGTVVDGEDAVKEGLIDELGGLSSAIAALEKMMRDKDEAQKAAKTAGSAGAKSKKSPKEKTKPKSKKKG